MTRIFCLVLLVIISAPAPAQPISDNVVFNTTNQASIGNLGMIRWAHRAQRFTTDNSADLTLRRIEFDISNLVLVYADKVRVSIMPDLNDHPNRSVSLGGFETALYGNNHCVLSGQVALQPNTTYWAYIDVISFTGDTTFNLGASAGGTGIGNWFGPGDDKSVMWDDDYGPTYSGDWFGGYFPSIQMVISTVPEPSSSAIFGLGTAALLFIRRRRVSD